MAPLPGVLWGGMRCRRYNCGEDAGPLTPTLSLKGRGSKIVGLRYANLI